MPNCSTCRYCEQNDSSVNVRIPKGMLKPHRKYCAHRKLRELTYSTLGSYNYPVWCPLNECYKTCTVCGTRIREEEGDYCKKHR